MPDNRRIVFYALSFLFLAGIALIGNVVDRSNSSVLLITFISVFGIYLTVWKNEETKALYYLGILARASLFFSLPYLSDDLYRFLWDGLLLKNGINPFAELPAYYTDKGISGLSPELFNLLNSPDYFTVYPPINQAIFWVAVMVSDNWLVAAGVIRLVLLAADVGTFHYLKKLLIKKELNENLAFLYFLNPLIILEGVGNLHFESLVIFFLTFSLYHFYSSKTLKSAFGMGLAIGTKLLPFIFLPFFFFKDINQKKINFTLVTLIIAIAALSPLYSPEFVAGMQSSLSLYFRNFEFNASIFFLVKEIGFSLTGENEIITIGPLLSLASFISIITISLIGYFKKWPPEKVMLFVLTSYLLFATTVHPWYILPLLMLAIFSGYIYPIIWSLMIFLTYMGYATDEYFLPMIWIMAEYFVVFLAFIFNNQLKKWLIIS
ncbi:MAG: hypothetical protein GY816_22610 [Cytophagales bacterium]|nr:hypothetical protein [Cytophagales bacterium]